jgi:hypothetical protein
MAVSRLLLALVALSAGSVPLNAQQDSYWLVVGVVGQWEYRIGDELPRPLVGAYEPLSPRGQVKCLEAVLSRCELRYLVSSRSKETQKLPVRLIQSGQWVALKGLKPPTLPIVPATSNELAARYGRVTRVGGSRTGSACGGDFPLKAPKCGENIDVSNFVVRWPAVQSQTLAVLVARVDGKTTLFRGNADGVSGAFSDSRLTSFLRTTQHATDPVDITVQVLADGGRSAVRLVRIPPRIQTAAFDARVNTIGLRSEASRLITIMTLAIEDNMWSRAADEATKLVGIAGSSLTLLEYALLGLCQSDYVDERAVLGSRIPPRRYLELCPPETTTPTTTAAAPAASESTRATSGPVPRNRLGIALLIGNSDYWNLPLNSVKNDIREMEATLSAVGFAVTTKENLRHPRQFAEALDDVLKRERATHDDVLLLYYSGHGVQLDGKAHLLTTGVSGSVQAAEDVRDNAQSAEDLLAQMERAIPGTRILIIEACRNDILSAASASGGGNRGGFAFQQDDVPNTFVMFANKPGLPAAGRSEFGLMGPFTQGLVYALENSAGSVPKLYEVAAEKARAISPAQEPVLYLSKSTTDLPLTRTTTAVADGRAKELLNNAEVLYRDRAWEEFRATVQRAGVLASNSELQQRLSREGEFAGLAMEASTFEKELRWTEAAKRWQKAHGLFPRRDWVGLNAAAAWLLADDVGAAARTLAVVAATSDSEGAREGARMLAELVNAFPELRADAERATRETTKVAAGPEFEKIGVGGTR